MQESREKEYQTRKKNGSFNTSKPEKELLEYIKLYFPNVEYHNIKIKKNIHLDVIFIFLN